MSYLVPSGRRSEREREAIRNVSALMEVADEARADEELERQDNAEEDANFDPASGAESPSTLRIIDRWNENRERGEDSADYYLRDLDGDAEALAEQTPDDAAERTRRAIESVARALRGEADEDAEGRSRRPAAIRVRYHDEERDDGLEDVSEPLRTVFDEERAMETFLPDLPDSQHEHQRRVAEANAFNFDDPGVRTSPAPEPAPVKDADDGYGEDRGEYEGPKVATSPPIWVPPDQR